MKMRLAGYHTDSIVDGPGIRLAIYFQGCPHGCPGCHNQETHDPTGGQEVDIEQVIDFINRGSGLDGVTLSGGEPFEQPAAAAALAAATAKRDLNLVLYSGYSFETLLDVSRKDSHVQFILEKGWLLIDGPFIQVERDLNLPYRGSRNQRIIDLLLSLQKGQAVIWEKLTSREG